MVDKHSSKSPLSIAAIFMHKYIILIVQTIINVTGSWKTDHVHERIGILLLTNFVATLMYYPDTTTE